GIVNGDRELEVVTVHAVEAFLDAESIAMRAARVIDPGSFVQSSGLNHERVVINPLADRVAEPTRLGIFGDLAPVCPDDSPHPAKLIQHIYCHGRLEDL